MSEQVNILDLIAFIVNRKRENVVALKDVIQNVSGDNPDIKGHVLEAITVTENNKTSTVKIIDNVVMYDKEDTEEGTIKVLMQALANIILEDVYYTDEYGNIETINPESDSTEQILKVLDEMSKNLS